jgi:hypothetical protein
MAARTAIAIQTEPGRYGALQVSPTTLVRVDGNVAYSGADDFYFEIVNTHASASITVTAVRKACPKCGNTAEPSGDGVITLAAGQRGFIGPLPADLYGQGDSGKDIYFDTTGSGTGTIKAFAV